MSETEVMYVNENDVQAPKEEAEAWFESNETARACVSKFVQVAKDPLWYEPEVPLELKRQRAAVLRKAAAAGEAISRLLACETRKLLTPFDLARLAPELDRLEQGRHTKADAARLVKALPQSGRGFYRYERQPGGDWQLARSR